MDRKKTILIAVLINAGLLAILFIASLATSEDISPQTVELTHSPLTTSMEKPLFPDAADLALQQQAGAQHQQTPVPIEIPLHEPVQVALPPTLSAAPAAEETASVHKLPPLVPEAVPAVPVAPQLAAKAEPAHSEVVVKKGDTLDKIAKAHHTTVDEIIKINHLPSSFLRVGQVLKLPIKGGAPIAAKPKAAIEKPAASQGAEYYTVKVGDNPWTIAMKHHLKVEELLKLNNLNEEKARKLKPGDRLRIR